MLKSFIRQARLRLWMSRNDNPETICEINRYLDTDFPTKDYAHSKIVNFPIELASLLNCALGSIHAYHRRGKFVFARASTHIGNSLIGYFPQGKVASSPSYGSIQYVFSVKGDFKFAVRPHKSANVAFDPFAQYPHFPAKLYRSQMGDLEIVHVDWVIGHFARWKYINDLVVILPLSRD